MQPGKYYAEKLSAQRLQRCYKVAPPRVQRYLEEEILHVLNRIRPTDRVLELGCGYGRVLERIAPGARNAVGIDNSRASLHWGRELCVHLPNLCLLEMEAAVLAFADRSFDISCCLQNGLSAFKVDPVGLLREMVRVTRRGGLLLLSSYAEKFWPERLEWFQRQAEEGLLGEIDWEATRNGTIICQDGFKATTISPAKFRELMDQLNLKGEIIEVDGSSLFCEIAV